MPRTIALLLAAALMAAPALAAAATATSEGASADAAGQADEDRTIRVRGDRGQGAFSMSMMQMTRQFRDSRERLAFRNAFNTVVENREREKGIRQAYENGDLSEAEYEHQRERVYRSMHGMTVEEILAEADE